jgi:RimJ/RimL family protein N-acetyltransferase
LERDPELLQLTCSDLLTLEEEYANQESWRRDESKLTFLIRDSTTQTNTLCGDINAFFSDYFSQDWDHCADDSTTEGPTGRVAEINLMIAEKTSRRKGIAEEALGLFMQYIRDQVPEVKIWVAKIQIGNGASVRLFEKIGFKEFKRVDCFNEVHFTLSE